MKNRGRREEKGKRFGLGLRENVCWGIAAGVTLAHTHTHAGEGLGLGLSLSVSLEIFPVRVSLRTARHKMLLLNK